MISFAPISVTEVVRILDAPRDNDRDELGDRDRKINLLHVAEKSDFLQGVWRDGLLLAVYGAYRETFLSNVGTVWFLGTPYLDANPLAVLRPAKDEITRIRSDYGYDKLVAWVFRRNDLSAKWMTWLGFEIRGQQQEYLYAEYV